MLDWAETLPLIRSMSTAGGRGAGQPDLRGQRRRGPSKQQMNTAGYTYAITN